MSTSTARRENRKAGRLILDHPLKVVMGSIGAHVKYQAVTRNISYSGIFLSFSNPARFPFTGSSILEVWLELEQGAIFFNGKMARIVYSDTIDPSQDNDPGIAIQIVLIDPENEKRLFRYIDDNLAMQKELRSKTAS